MSVGMEFMLLNSLGSWLYRLYPLSVKLQFQFFEIGSWGFELDA